MTADAVATLAAMFACPDPRRMKWEHRIAGLHDCRGCSGHCGLGLPAGDPLEPLFQPATSQLDLFTA